MDESSIAARGREEAGKVIKGREGEEGGVGGVAGVGGSG